MLIQIQPTQVFGNKTATQIEFMPASLTFGESASSNYALMDVDGLNLVCSSVSLTAEQYAAWGTDDTYAIDCFLSNLGLQRL